MFHVILSVGKLIGSTSRRLGRVAKKTTDLVVFTLHAGRDQVKDTAVSVDDIVDRVGNSLVGRSGTSAKTLKSAGGRRVRRRRRGGSSGKLLESDYDWVDIDSYKSKLSTNKRYVRKTPLSQLGRYKKCSQPGNGPVTYEFENDHVTGLPDGVPDGTVGSFIAEDTSDSGNAFIECAPAAGAHSINASGRMSYNAAGHTPLINISSGTNINKTRFNKLDAQSRTPEQPSIPTGWKRHRLDKDTELNIGRSGKALTAPPGAAPVAPSVAEETVIKEGELEKLSEYWKNWNT